MIYINIKINKYIKRANEGISTGINDDILSETEQINFIENLIENNNKEKTVTDFELESQKLQSFFISNNSEISKTSAKELNQFVIKDENLGTGGEKEKFRRNFIGRLPEAMAKSNIYGVELDSISGRIAKQLYQKSNIEIQGFQEIDYPDNSFDVAI